MDDLISRQAAYEALTAYYHHTTDMQHAALHDALNRVPSAQPEKRTENTRKTHGVFLDLIDRQAAIDAIEKTNIPEDMCVFEIVSHIETEIATLPSASPEQDPDEWCTDCKEYDKERHCCPRFNRVIRTAMADAQPEIIRCKDCKHWKNKHLCESLSRYGSYETKADFYCGYAERKTND